MNIQLKEIRLGNDGDKLQVINCATDESYEMLREKGELDIKSKAPYPGNVLSNFYPNEFEIDGIKCASMEGFLQSLKTKNVEKQKKVCALYGKEAKLFFRHKWDNLRWKLTGKLYWNGMKIRRSGGLYQDLLSRAYDQLLGVEEFAKALAITGDIPLKHSIGKHNKRKTILTEEEFISELYRLRDIINHNDRIMYAPEMPTENNS